MRPGGRTRGRAPRRTRSRGPPPPRGRSCRTPRRMERRRRPSRSGTGRGPARAPGPRTAPSRGTTGTGGPGMPPRPPRQGQPHPRGTAPALACSFSRALRGACTCRAARRTPWGPYARRPPSTTPGADGRGLWGPPPAGGRAGLVGAPSLGRARHAPCSCSCSCSCAGTRARRRVPALSDDRRGSSLVASGGRFRLAQMGDQFTTGAKGGTPRDEGESTAARGVR